MELKTCAKPGCSLYAKPGGKHCFYHDKLSGTTQKGVKIKKKANKYNHLGFKSQIDLFKYCWDNHKRKCYVTGEDLNKYNGGVQFLSLFAHVLPKAKAKYPEFKLYINNIVLLTPKCHFLYDQGSLDQILKFEAQHNFCFRILFELERDIFNEYVSSFGKKNVERKIVERYLEIKK